MNISILNFAHLHTMNDFSQLLVTADIANKLDLEEHVDNIRQYLPNFPSSFYECFYQEMSYFEKNTLKTSFKHKHQTLYMLKSPCIEKRHSNSCEEYCRWSKEAKWSTFFTDKEFHSLMKFALPQATLPENQDESEYDMASKIVGKESLKRTPKVAPVPLVILCKYQKYQEWEGKDIGMDTKFCDSFVQVPSDVGVCISGAMNTADIFESDIFGGNWNSRKIKGGTYSSSSTFILDIGNVDTSHSFLRSNDTLLNEIEMQIHPINELAQILHEPNQDHSTRSFTLKERREYTFEVTIDGRIITDNFRELTIDQRKCKLKKEVDQNSWFMHYSKRQCKFMCRTKLAYNACGCIPWDIYHIGNYSECDVFGRTCFKNMMENITHTDGLCEDCYDDCKYLRYRYKMNREVEIPWYNWDYFYYEECNDMKDFCDYLKDSNFTLDDKYSPKDIFDEAHGAIRERFRRIIIVNIVFPTSEADLTVIDVRYTLDWLNFQKSVQITSNIGVVV